MQTEELMEQALKLEPQSRLAMAEQLLDSLDPVDPAIESAWLDEAERRLAAYRAGKLKAIPIEDVLGEL